MESSDGETLIAVGIWFQICGATIHPSIVYFADAAIKNNKAHKIKRCNTILRSLQKIDVALGLHRHLLVA